MIITIITMNDEDGSSKKILIFPHFSTRSAHQDRVPVVSEQAFERPRPRGMLDNGLALPLSEQWWIMS